MVILFPGVTYYLFTFFCTGVSGLVPLFRDSYLFIPLITVSLLLFDQMFIMNDMFSISVIITIASHLQRRSKNIRTGRILLLASCGGNPIYQGRLALIYL